MGIPSEYKDTKTYRMIGGLDENDDAQELRFTGSRVNIIAPLVDTYSQAAVGIDYPHWKVHQGLYYRAGFDYSLANGQVATLGFTVADGTYPHIDFDLTATADGTFELIEDVTSLSGGASVTPLNHSRNSTNTSNVTVVKGMTGSDLITPTGGTTILNVTLSTGHGVDIARGGPGEEFIFMTDAIYLFRYTNGVNANVVRLVLEWYE